jgi:HK97 family phage major capsid protein
MVDNTDVNVAITELGTAFEAFKETHATQLRELKSGFADVVTTEKLQRINDALDTAEEVKSGIEKRLAEVELRIARPGAFSGSQVDETELRSFNAQRSSRGMHNTIGSTEVKAYGEALNTWLRKGDNAINSDVERKALSVGADPDGGFLVTPDRSGGLVKRIFLTSPVRQLAQVQSISSDTLEGMFDNDQAASGWVGETDSRPVTGTSKIGKWQIVAHEQYALAVATQKMLDDASIDVGAWLDGKIADKMARTENTAFVNGNGVTQPRGFTTYDTTTSDDTARTKWDSIQYIKTGVNGGFASGATGPDALFNIVQKFNPAYLGAAVWGTTREVVGKVRTFKSSVTGEYIWQPGLSAGTPSQIIGIPYSILEDLPALSANSGSLYLASWKDAYQIVDRLGARALRDPFSAKPYIQFYVYKRTGGGVLNFDAIKFVSFSA